MFLQHLGLSDARGYKYFNFKSTVRKESHLDGSSSKESAYKAGDTGDSGSVPGSGISPREGNGNPLQYSFLENPMDRGAQKPILHRVEMKRTILNT